MSTHPGQNNQRVRRIASPSTKQGPMKATLPFALMAQSPTRPPASNGRKISPSSSPTPPRMDAHRPKSRRSPDARASPERSSPSSPGFKVERPKPIRVTPGSSSIKRTGSFDTIAGPYLTGQWPKGELLQTITSASQAGCAQGVVLRTDRATQTPEAWDEVGSERMRRSQHLSITPAHKRSASVGGAGGDSTERKIIKQRLAKTKEGRSSTASIQRLSPVQGIHIINPQCSSLIQSKAVAIPVLVKPAVRIRGSVEGLNLEIQRALKSTGCDEDSITIRTQDTVPEGHQAPIAELILGCRTCSVDTQTPSGFLEELKLSEEGGIGEEGSGTSSQSSSRSQSESPSILIIPGPLLDTSVSSSSRPSSQDADSCSPDNNKDEELLNINKYDGRNSENKSVPSPNPNQDFVREPPDGCEKVKIIDEARGPPPTKEPLLYCPIKKSIPACQIPSSMSAFYAPLYQRYLAPEMALKTPPNGSPLGTPAPIEAQQIS